MQIFEFFGKLSLWASPEGKPYSKLALAFESKNYTDGSGVVNLTADLHLVSSSPYENAGTDGTDIGIYGGAYPWQDGSVPFNPHVITKQIAPVTDSNGNLQITIKVQAQEN